MKHYTYITGANSYRKVLPILACFILGLLFTSAICSADVVVNLSETTEGEFTVGVGDISTKLAIDPPDGILGGYLQYSTDEEDDGSEITVSATHIPPGLVLKVALENIPKDGSYGTYMSPVKLSESLKTLISDIPKDCNTENFGNGYGFPITYTLVITNISELVATDGESITVTYTIFGPSGT